MLFIIIGTIYAIFGIYMELFYNGPKSFFEYTGIIFIAIIFYGSIILIFIKSIKQIIKNDGKQRKSNEGI